jgi:hypothetical protein
VGGDGVFFVRSNVGQAILVSVVSVVAAAADDDDDE